MIIHRQQYTKWLCQLSRQQGVLRQAGFKFSTDEHKKKGFDFQKFEEERRRQKQKFKAESQQQADSKTSSEDGGERPQSQSNQRGTIIQLTPAISRDLVLLNLPKYVSKEDLKRQYHKLAKQYHPDIINSKAAGLLPEAKIKQMEEKFKEFNQAYERLVAWIDERDAILEDDLKHGRNPSAKYNQDDGSVSYTFGKLVLEGKRSQMDRQKLLENMIEEEFQIKEPRNLIRYLVISWALIGVWVFYKDFKYYYNKQSQRRDGVEYEEYFKLWSTRIPHKQTDI